MSARTMVAGTSTTNHTGASESTGSAAPSLITRGGFSRWSANARVVQAPDDGVAISVSISIRPLARTAESKLLRHWRLQYRCRCPSGPPRPERPIAPEAARPVFRWGSVRDYRHASLLIVQSTFLRGTRHANRRARGQ